jgi:succinate dehydrogenase / fumarate reductase flavoprotein subunit
LHIRGNEFKDAENAVHVKTKKLFSIKGKKDVYTFHKQLGKLIWDYCGMARSEEGLKEGKRLVRSLRESFWNEALVTGDDSSYNVVLEKAHRVADFMELGELMIDDAMNRNESCGGHFREEYQTPEGEALRDDKNFSYVAAWEYKGPDAPEVLHKEKLVFENVKLTQRSYK